MKLLDAISKQFGGSTDEDLATALQSARDERRRFIREHRSRFRSDYHGMLDTRVARELAEVEVILSAIASGPGGGGFSPLSLSETHARWAAVTDAAFLDGLHARIDALPASMFTTISRADFDQEVGRLDAVVSKTEAEIARRDAAEARRVGAEQVAAADAELDTIAKRLS